MTNNSDNPGNNKQPSHPDTPGKPTHTPGQGPKNPPTPGEGRKVG